VLVESLLAAKWPITVVSVSWGIKELLESLRTAKPLVALVTLVRRSVSSRAEVLVESLLASE
jgi:hypothetical protein